MELILLGILSFNNCLLFICSYILLFQLLSRQQLDSIIQNKNIYKKNANNSGTGSNVVQRTRTWLKDIKIYLW